MSSGITEPKNEIHQDGQVDIHDVKENNVHYIEILVNPDLMSDAFHGEDREHEMGMWEAVKNYPMACFWAFIKCFTIVLESFDMFLNATFVALPAFKSKYGVFVEDPILPSPPDGRAPSSNPAYSLTVLVIGQTFEGVPWGFFIANFPAYASEVAPLVFRGACTATLQMSWSVGGIIVAAATYGYNQRTDKWAWRVPLALQWIFQCEAM